jgi:hypothetical protein
MKKKKLKTLKKSKISKLNKYSQTYNSLLKMNSNLKLSKTHSLFIIFLSIMFGLKYSIKIINFLTLIFKNVNSLMKITILPIIPLIIMTHNQNLLQTPLLNNKLILSIIKKILKIISDHSYSLKIAS